MRIGTNPAKLSPKIDQYGLHRVIVPVYIPHFSGYFAQALDVLRLCLDSLWLTTGGRAAVTVVTNGCDRAVVEEVDRRRHEGQIDQVVHNRRNRGKIDAVVSVARGSFEALLTISDCDVLFRPGWAEAVHEVFNAFPECGFVTPFPSPGGEGYHTSTTVLGATARRELRIEKVVCDEELDRFARSINNPDFFTPTKRAGQLLVRRNGVSACVGGGHFVCTIRKEVVAAMPLNPSLTAVSGNSEEKWLDESPDRAGFWRLATTRAYVQHMGNTLEPWMSEELDASVRNVTPTTAPTRLGPPTPDWVRWIPYRLRLQIARRGIVPVCKRKVARRMLDSDAVAPPSSHP